MNAYILHVALLLTGCLLFYKTLLQRETFFRLNRVVLLACLLLSFALPLLPVPQQWSLRKAEVAESIVVDPVLPYTPTHLPAASPVTPNTTTVVEESGGLKTGQLLQWSVWLYWFGVLAFAINFLVQVAVLLYRAYSRPVIRDGRFRIVELSGDGAPCSFGNSIFINPEKYDWDTYNQILLHEKVHIEQGHTLDLLLAEIVLVFQWFNPFAWIYRKELESNLEFLTDNQLLQHRDVEQTAYQLSLLKVSAPHFPLSLTTNYNQSLLKKRFIMMNAKKSNVNTTWKYLFLFPVLALFVSLLNEPVAIAQTTTAKAGDPGTGLSVKEATIKTEGAWFATIKGDKVSMQFKSDDDENSNNSNSFALSEFKNLPRDQSGTFTLTRDAGTFHFTGKFEGDQGMGRYKFVADKSFADYLRTEGVDKADDADLMVFALVNVSRSYVAMLKSAGYTRLKKQDLIPLAALKVDGAYIQSLKSAGFAKLELRDLIPLKALGVDAAYVQDIHKAGYANISAQKLISLKAQGIDGNYISDVRNSAGQTQSPVPMRKNEADRKTDLSPKAKNEASDEEPVISERGIAGITDRRSEENDYDDLDDMAALRR
jgi:hypothetical protein